MHNALFRHYRRIKVAEKSHSHFYYIYTPTLTINVNNSNVGIRKINFLLKSN